MKKYLYTYVIVLLSLFCSCSTTKDYQVQRKNNILNSKENATGCFVKYNDGSIKNFTTLKLVTGILKTPYLLGDGKIRIYSKDISAYQDHKNYAISQNSFSAKYLTPVAVECLPGFAVRIAKGKLNVYVRKHYNTQNAVDEFFLQSGENGQILAYSPTVMNDLIKSSPEAYEFFNGNKIKTIKPKKLQVAAEIFNSSGSITKK